MDYDKNKIDWQSGTASNEPQTVTLPHTTATLVAAAEQRGIAIGLDRAAQTAISFANEFNPSDCYTAEDTALTVTARDQYLSLATQLRQQADDLRNKEGE